MAYRDELEAARARAQALEEKLAAREAELEALHRAAARRAPPAPPPAPPGSGPLTRQIVAGTLLLSFFTSGYLMVTREPRPMPRKRAAAMDRALHDRARGELRVQGETRARGFEGRLRDGRDARGRDPRGEGPRSRRGEACSSDPTRTTSCGAEVEAQDP